MNSKKIAGLRLLTALVAVASLAALSACGKVEAVTAPDFTPPGTIAVLPVANQAVDVDGPPLYRKLLEAKLVEKGYTVIDPAKVDETLKSQFDIEEGGQLNAAEPKELAKALGADALLYCTLTEWEKHSLLYYNDVIVGGKFELLNAEGAEIWKVEHHQVKQVKIALNLRDAIVNTAANLFTAYEKLANELMDKVLRTLPNR
ncbi:MAG: GNA1162 family protein [Bdellovibrionota bacterium]